MNRRLALIAGAFLSLACASCSQQSSLPATQATPAPAVVSPPGPAVTEGDVHRFAKDLEKAVAAQDSARANELFRFPELFERSISDLGASADFFKGVKQGIQAASAQNTFGTQIVAQVAKGGSYRLLRVHVVDGRHRALFRLIQPSKGGVNYHDLLVARFPDGRIGMEDAHIYVTDELLSQSMRRLFIPLIAESNRGALSRLAGADREYLDNLPLLKQFTGAIRAGRHAEALTIYRKLPTKLQQDRTIMIMYVQAASGADQSEYAAAMEAMRTSFPKDTCTEFLSIDYYVLRKEFDESIRSIDRLDKRLGGDPYLNVMRAGTMILAERYAEAGAAAEKAVAAEPNLAPAYWSRITVSLKQKEFQDTFRWLRLVVEKCGEDVADLTTVPEYAEFVKSPSYKDWLKWQKSRQK